MPDAFIHDAIVLSPFQLPIEDTVIQLTVHERRSRRTEL